MSWEIQSKAEQLNIKRRKRRLWYRILFIPACIVVFITTYAMILPAITLDSSPDTDCGIEEHIHSDSCYKIPSIPKHKEIRCAVQENLHIHTDECFGDDGKIVCGKADYLIHTHDSFCFDDKGELICQIEEVKEHIHKKECYDESENLICGKTKGAAHQHTAECVITVPKTDPQKLICEKTEHKHTKDCFYDDEKTDYKVQKAARAVSNGKFDGVYLEIIDDILQSGCYKVNAVDESNLLIGETVRYLWYKSTDGGQTYTAVSKKAFDVNGKTLTNISDDNGGDSINPALDGGTLTSTQLSVTYKVTLMVNGIEYDDISAVVVNDKYQGSVLNGSFEAPDLTDHNYQEFVPEGTSGLYWKTTAENIEADQSIYGGGKTQANDGEHYIEVIDTSGNANNQSSHKYQATNWHGQGTASDGKQYAEISAGAQGALYQTISTIPGTVMNWSVDHSGRNGTDTMAVVVMSETVAAKLTTQSQLTEAINTILNGDTENKYGGAFATLHSAEKGVWSTASGTFIIPEGQYETRFFFFAMSSSDNDASSGNHIDNAWFSQKIPPASSTKPYFTINKTINGDISEDELTALSPKLVFSILQSRTQSFASATTIKEYTAYELGDWVKTQNGYTLSARIYVGDESVYPKTYGRRNNYYYKIVENEKSAKIDHYDLIVTDNNTATTITSSTEKGFYFTNTYKDTGRTFKLTKIVNASNKNGSFEFSVSYKSADGTDKNETFTLKNEQSKSFLDVKKGTTVTVSEITTDGYSVAIKDEATGKILTDSNSYSFTVSDDVSLTVCNTASVMLPETGGIGNYVFVFGGLFIMTAAVIIKCLIRRRYGKEGD